MNKGCFQIKDWHSNVRDLETAEDGSDTAVLGVPWDKKEDMLLIQDPEWKQVLPTRRSILSAVSKIWDPLGILSPVLVEAKLELHKLALADRGWDDVIPEEEAEVWKDVLSNIEKGIQSKLKRNIGLAGGQSILHGFCDAGQEAYGAAFWLQNAQGLSFVAAKTLVSRPMSGQFLGSS